MRKTIFEIVKENETLEEDIKRIIRLFKHEKTIYFNMGYTLFDFVDSYCFTGWKNRGHCIDMQDFLRCINYQKIENMSSRSETYMLLFVELVCNFWKLANKKIDNNKVKPYQNFILLREILNDVLEKVNYKAYYNKEQEQVIVVEDKPEVTAVAEIAPEPIALDIIKYNHHTLKENIELKKKILLAMGADLEPKRKQLKTINSTLEDNIFRMLNEFNLRHNNVNPQDNKNYRADIAALSSQQMEEWYDELYQMILLAYLTLDNIERGNKIKKFYDKRNNNGEQTNG
ncbi:MAG: hypothetical protein K2M50_01000 [Treponemataceae bacterium]|nr:hypothetical protein [Treponemataceae bacterium]